MIKRLTEMPIAMAMAMLIKKIYTNQKKAQGMEVNEPNFDKIFNFEDRLVRFAGECILFVRKLEKSYEVDYYKNQLIRSSGSSSLNYGEAQGTITGKDFIFKVSLSVKELKESRNTLKVIEYIKTGDFEERKWLLNEVEELIAIASKMINNKK